MTPSVPVGDRREKHLEADQKVLQLHIRKLGKLVERPYIVIESRHADRIGPIF